MSIATTVGRVAVSSIGDRVGITGKASTAGHVPGSAEAITVEWLTAALCRDTPGAAVTGFTITGGSDGTSARRAITIDYNDAGHAAGLPTRVFSKSSATFSTRMLLGVTGITEGEAIFFNHLRPHVELRSPRAYFAASEASSCRSIVLLEDLAQKGWSFPDPMTNTVTEQDASDMIDQMAAYHAAFWDGRQEAGALNRLQTPLAIQLKLNQAARFPKRTRVGLERAQSIVPRGLWSRREELWPAVMRSAELCEHGPQTLLHQDVHLGNWLRDADGRMGLYDWQTIARGSWAIDVAYALTIDLERDDRLAWERDLIARYVAQLAEHGVPEPPTVDEAFLEYRRHPMHAYAFCLFTNGQPRYLPELQPPDYTRRSVERITAALEDLGTLDALRQ